MGDPELPRVVEAEEDVEEDVADWSQFAKLLSKKDPLTTAFIPKKGEKDFEPVSSLADIQSNALIKARNDMFAALKAGDSRQHSSKAHNAAIWHPDLARASIKVTYGIHFQTMGHYSPARERLELFPEELLYLIERGTLECFTEEGIAMSVQHAYAVALGQEDLTMERYQIYAYLKRLGYAVFRATHGLRPPFEEQIAPRPSFFDLLYQRISRIMYRTFGYPLQSLAAYCRLCDPPYTRTRVSGKRNLLEDVRWNNYKQAFQALRIVPAGHSQPLVQRLSSLGKIQNNPFKVFWHVYKPITKIQKKRLPNPDFYVAVIDATKHGMPTLFQLTDVYQSLPPFIAAAPPLATDSLFIRLLSSIGLIKRKASTYRPPNPYARLKTGEQMLVVAVVENGVSTFIKFAADSFSKYPWV